MKRDISMTVAAMAVIAFASPAVQAAIIFESATLGPTGGLGGITLGSTEVQLPPLHEKTRADFFLGSRFSVDTVVDVESVGGVMYSDRGGSFFAAIVSLSSSTALPSGNPFDMTTLATTVFTPPAANNDILTPLSVTLNPGDYALIFGSEFFGATEGYGAMSASNADIAGPASYIGWQFWGGESGNWYNSPGAAGLRFVVTGMIPEPGSWLLAAVATGFLVMTAGGHTASQSQSKTGQREWPSCGAVSQSGGTITR